MKVILMFTKDFPAERHIYYDLKLDIFSIFRILLKVLTAN